MVDLNYFNQFQGGESSGKLPRVQILNPVVKYDSIGIPSGAKPWGWAIEQKFAHEANFKPDSDWEFIPDYKFESGNTLPVYITKNPRLVVLDRGELLIRDRETKALLGRFFPDYVSAYRANKDKYQLINGGMVIFFVGKDKRLLHTKPFKSTFGGAAGASFADALGKVDHSIEKITSGFYKDLQDCFCERQRLDPNTTVMGQGFFAYAIFNGICEVQRVGGDASSVSPVCRTDKYIVPTVETLGDFLIDPESPAGKTIMHYLQNLPKEQLPIPKPETPKPVQKHEPEQPQEFAFFGQLVEEPTYTKVRDKEFAKIVVMYADRHGDKEVTCAVSGEALISVVRQHLCKGAVAHITAKPLPNRTDGLMGVLAIEIPEAQRNEVEELISQIDEIYPKIGWSKQQAQQYVRRTYRIYTRRNMTVKQLREFLAYLRRQPFKVS